MTLPRRAWRTQASFIDHVAFAPIDPTKDQQLRERFAWSKCPVRPFLTRLGPTRCAKYAQPAGGRKSSGADRIATVGVV